MGKPLLALLGTAAMIIGIAIGTVLAIEMENNPGLLAVVVVCVVVLLFVLFIIRRLG